MSGNIIQLNEQFIHNELKTIVKNSVEETLNALLDAEADKLVQAERYARDQTIKGYRTKHYERSFSTQTSDVTLKVPKLKGFTFESAIIQRYQRRKCSVKEALVEMYFAGADIIIKGGKQYAVNIFFLWYVHQFARF
jgi:putative transposase